MKTWVSSPSVATHGIRLKERPVGLALPSSLSAQKINSVCVQAHSWGDHTRGHTPQAAALTCPALLEGCSSRKPCGYQCSTTPTVEGTMHHCKTFRHSVPPIVGEMRHCCTLHSVGKWPWFCSTQLLPSTKADQRSGHVVMFLPHMAASHPR